MTDQWTVKVDKQVMSLYTITVWSNLICIGLLAAINLVSFFRGDSAAAAAGEARRLLSPDMLLLLSAVCAIWLVINLFSTRRLARRMANVFLTMDGDTISGVSLPDPASPPRNYPTGRPFTVQVRDLRDVSSKEMRITKKQVAPALVLTTAEDTYVLPGIERVHEIKSHILRRMDTYSNRV